MAFRFPSQHTAALSLLLGVTCLTAACSTTDASDDGSKVNYRTLGAKTVPLDVPPDLSQLPQDARFGQAPSSETGPAVTRTPPSAPASFTTAPPVVQERVSPNANPAATLERAGQLRWLASSRSPESLWPELKAFWKDAGFTLITEDPNTGVIETDWAENRAKLKEDFIRRSIGKLFDRMYDSGERDRYTMRLERTASGGSEIYVAHRGLEEIYTGDKKTDKSTTWRGRGSDPQLESIMLAQLLTKLGAAPAEPKTARPSSPPIGTAASTTGDSQEAASGSLSGIAQLLPGTDDSYTTVQINEGLDGAWRRLPVSLNRAGYQVTHRNRQQASMRISATDDKAHPRTTLRLQLRDAGGSRTVVQIQNEAGQNDKSDAAKALAKALVQAL